LEVGWLDVLFFYSSFSINEPDFPARFCDILLSKFSFSLPGGPNTWKTVLSSIRGKEIVPIVVFNEVGGVSQKIARYIQEHEWHARIRGVGTNPPTSPEQKEPLKPEEEEYLKEIIGDAQGYIEIINPTTDTAETCRDKILRLATAIEVDEVFSSYGVEGFTNVVLPMHISMIQHLDLSKNNIRDAGVKEFARYLEYNTSLVEVDLSDNDISDIGAEYLARALMRNRTIRQLHLNGNKGITSGGVEKLDCVAMSREVPCLFSRDQKLGIGISNQTYMIEHFYGKWRNVLHDALKNDSEIQDRTSVTDFADLELPMLAWPLHTSVRYPTLLSQMVGDFVVATEIKKDLVKYFNAPDLQGKTVLHHAVEQGFVESVSILLNTPRLKVNRQFKRADCSGYTVYSRALKQFEWCDTALSEKLQEEEMAATIDEFTASADNVNANIDEDSSFEEDSRSATMKVDLAAAVLDELHAHKSVSNIRRRFARNYFFTSSFFYVLFLALGVIVAINTTVGFNQDRFRLRETVLSAITQPDFMDIGSDGDFWPWLTGPLADAVFPTNGGSTNEFYLYGENRVFGAVRIRQIRTKSHKCNLPGVLEMLSFSDVCYPSWDSSSQGSKSISTDLDLSAFNLENDGMEWKSGVDLGYHHKFTIRGQTALHDWDGSGFAIDIPTGDPTTARDILDAIENSDWISRETRAIFVETNFYNPNLDTFVFGMMIVEIPPSNGYFPSSVFVPMPSSRFSERTSRDLAFLVLEIAFLVLALYFLVQECSFALIYQFPFFSSLE
jgi:hypothetical protein